MTKKVFDPDQQFYTQDDLQKYFSDLESYRESLDKEKKILYDQQSIIDTISKQVYSS